MSLHQERLYFRRYRMQASMSDLPAALELPPRYRWISWRESIFNMHAQVMCRAFAESIDIQVFPNLGSWPGCMNIMQAIIDKPGFCPEGTWLLQCPIDTIGCIQTVQADSGLGMIQNVGVLPEWQGHGFGTQLILQAAAGLRRQGCERLQLEVTVQNERAVKLYHRLGFQIREQLLQEVKQKPKPALYISPLNP